MLSPSLPSSLSRRKSPPAPLSITTLPLASNIIPISTDISAPPSSIDSAASDSHSFIYPPASVHSRDRNMKKLSLTLPSARTSSLSLAAPSDFSDSVHPRRRPSVVSLPNPTTSLLRKDEDLDGSSSPPYRDGPVQVLPGIWLGSEENARDWVTLRDRGIKSILNVAQEVTTLFDSSSAHSSLRPTVSTPDLFVPVSQSPDPTFYPAHLPTGRPNMHYLKLPWSHGQSDLVTDGFPTAMSFVDSALQRGDGVLIHCQCGVSRSATLVIALVMRAAVQGSPAVPPEVWALKGMHAAYAFVKEKSKWVSPNMSLIYQLMDYERTFKPESSSTTSDKSSIITEEEEWGRRRQMMDEDSEENDRECIKEARALDKAMEDRLLARRASITSLGPSNGFSVGPTRRSRCVPGRKRAGSIASIVTTSSVLSERLMEEDEEPETLGVGGGFAETSCSSTDPTEDETSSMSSGDPNSRRTSPSSDVDMHPRFFPTARLRLASVPAHKQTFALPPVPASATRSSFDLTSRPTVKSKPRRRPTPLFNTLPPVPSSPITPVCPGTARARTEGRKSSSQARLPSTRKASSNSTSSTKSGFSLPFSATPSQVLFVFPPSPTNATTLRTPSTMTVTSNSSYPLPVATAPRVSTLKSHGRSRSFIGLGAPPTPTIASSRVDARGWVGLS